MRARLHRCRALPLRVWAALFLTCSFLMYCYFYNGASRIKYGTPSRNSAKIDESVRKSEIVATKWFLSEQCPLVMESQTDIDTVDIYKKFEFSPSWLPTKEFWDKSFEDRYTLLRYADNRPPLKVFVVPHSHNDPGWLKTFEQYFEWKTKNIITNIVQKLEQYPEMTFIWTEIIFLEAWWERAHPSKQIALKKLIKQGRLEITTGGWVMPDEACTHIYSLLDQYIEGHEWVRTHLGIAPQTGWSVDPFGHGPTVPHLLDQSGLKGNVIQRIHYAWKQYLAQQQVEEFYWIPGWSTKKPSLITHNMPFDIYSIKHSCGPHTSVCLSYDFRLIPGEYSEYTAKHEDITDQNLHKKAKTLIEEYHRIGTLTPHNVVLVPLGDDFRYDFSSEFDAQYTNYMKIFDYINSHKDMFNAEIQFGTPLDYFNEVKKRYNTSTLETIRTLKGDFFVYSDIFSSGKPAYWSGFYTTRPYMKILARQFEHQLRTSEILFTLVYNSIKRNFNKPEALEKKLEKSYEQLVMARRHLGLVQHHDAITGTSKAAVTNDYGTKMFTSLYHCTRLQEIVLSMAMIPDSAIHPRSALQSELEWETYGKPVKKHQHEVNLLGDRKIVVFNSLAQERVEVVTTSISVSNVKVYDNHRKELVPHQIIPSIDVHSDGRRVISDSNFELVFIAKLPALTAVTFTLSRSQNDTAHCDVFCSNCGTPSNKKFNILKMPPGDILLENSVLRVLVNRNTGFLRQVYRKDINIKNMVEMEIGAYRSAQGQSGPYLFMPDVDTPEKSVLEPYANFDNLQDDNIIILSGPITTEIKIIYLPFLVHTIKIFNVDDYALSHAIYIENIVDFESPPKNRETELYMRLNSDILNNDPTPEFYSDQNGFQYQRRVKIDGLGIEGNYYPITTMAWIQDNVTRMTLITNHAQGASAFAPGRLEVMLDRRMLYDDYRGLGEGIVDNKKTTFQNWLLLESASPAERKRKRENVPETDDFESITATQWEKKKTDKPINKRKREYQLPSQTADYLSRTLNYPVNVFFLDSSEVGDIDMKPYMKFALNFPEDLHLVTLRTITDSELDQLPSSNSYLILQRPGVSCHIGHRGLRKSRFTWDSKFNDLKIKKITSVSLTGLETLYNISSLEEIELESMDLKTFRLKF